MALNSGRGGTGGKSKSGRARSGMTLVEVSIGAGLAVSVLLLLVKMSSNVGQSQKTIEAAADMNSLSGRIGMVLWNPDLCNALVSGKPAIAMNPNGVVPNGALSLTLPSGGNSLLHSGETIAPGYPKTGPMVFTSVQLVYGTPANNAPTLSTLGKRMPVSLVLTMTNRSTDPALQTQGGKTVTRSFDFAAYVLNNTVTQCGDATAFETDCVELGGTPTVNGTATFPVPNPTTAAAAQSLACILPGCPIVGNIMEGLDTTSTTGRCWAYAPAGCTTANQFAAGTADSGDLICRGIAGATTPSAATTCPSKPAKSNKTPPEPAQYSFVAGLNPDGTVDCQPLNLDCKGAWGSCIPTAGAPNGSGGCNGQQVPGVDIYNVSRVRIGLAAKECPYQNGAWRSDCCQSCLKTSTVTWPLNAQGKWDGIIPIPNPYPVPAPTGNWLLATAPAGWTPFPAAPNCTMTTTQPATSDPNCCSGLSKYYALCSNAADGSSFPWKCFQQSVCVDPTPPASACDVFTGINCNITCADPTSSCTDGTPSFNLPFPAAGSSCTSSPCTVTTGSPVNFAFSVTFNSCPANGGANNKIKCTLDGPWPNSGVEMDCTAPLSAMRSADHPSVYAQFLRKLIQAGDDGFASALATGPEASQTSSSAAYASLPAGDYTLTVRAKTGKNSATQSIGFTVGSKKKLCNVTGSTNMASGTYTVKNEPDFNGSCGATAQPTLEQTCYATSWENCDPSVVVFTGGMKSKSKNPDDGGGLVATGAGAQATGGFNDHCMIRAGNKCVLGTDWLEAGAEADSSVDCPSGSSPHANNGKACSAHTKSRVDIDCDCIQD